MLRFLSFVALAGLALAAELGTHGYLGKASFNVGIDTVTNCKKLDLVVGGIINWDDQEVLPVQTVLRSEGEGACSWLAIASHHGELLACELQASKAGASVFAREHNCKKTSDGFQGDFVEAAKANFATMAPATNLQPQHVWPFLLGSKARVGSSVQVTLEIGAATSDATWCANEVTTGQEDTQHQKLMTTFFEKHIDDPKAHKAVNCESGIKLATTPKIVYGAKLVFMVSRHPISGRRLDAVWKLFAAHDLQKFCAIHGFTCKVKKLIWPNMDPNPKQIQKKPLNLGGVKVGVVPDKVIPALESTPGDIGAAKKLAKANNKFELNTLKGIGGTASVACVACVLLLAAGILVVKVRNSRNDAEEELPLTDPVE